MKFTMSSSIKIARMFCHGQQKTANMFHPLKCQRGLQTFSIVQPCVRNSAQTFMDSRRRYHSSVSLLGRQNPKNSDRDKDKISFVVKMEIAKFLQDSFRLNFLQTAETFVEYFEKVRSEGGLCTSEEILKLSKLFEEVITLHTLSPVQLMALCRFFGLIPVGTPNFMELQLLMKVQSLASEDEGLLKRINSLSVYEIRKLCRERGIREYDVSFDRMMFDLQQWWKLSQNKNCPPALLLISRVMILADNLPNSDQVQSRIYAFHKTKAKNSESDVSQEEIVVGNEMLKIQKSQEESRKRRSLIKSKFENVKLKQEAKELVQEASEVVHSTIDSEINKLFHRANSALNSIGHLQQKLVENEVSQEDIAFLRDAVDELTRYETNIRLLNDELSNLIREVTMYKKDNLAEALETPEIMTLWEIIKGKLKEHDLWKSYKARNAGWLELPIATRIFVEKLHQLRLLKAHPNTQQKRHKNS